MKEHILDLIIIVVILAGFIRGFKVGFLPVLIETAGIIGGVLVALQYYMDISYVLLSYLPISQTVSVFIAFLGIWGVMYSIARLLSQLIKPLMTLSLMRPIDRFIGAFLGAARSFCMVLPLLIPLSYTDLEIYHDSKIAKPLNAMVYQKLPSIQETSSVLSSRLSKEPSKVTSPSKPSRDDLTRLQEAIESNNLESVRDLID